MLGQERAMTDRFTPVLRALVVASLLFATATLMLVAVSTARAASSQPMRLAGTLERSVAA
jgi:hypothetical protein